MGSSSREPVIRFPKELEKFLSRPTYSLLIRGSSGSGKTILALTILGSLKKSESILYISTRSSPSQLLKDHPWTQKLFASDTATLGGTEAPREGWEALVDARLDEPGTVFERITNVLMDKQAPTVVVDSWESLDDSADKDSLRTNMRVLQTWRERAGARFIFIGEDATRATIDPIMEGVVVLSEQSYQGRRLREISLSKLHGVRISRPSYFFSLEGGAFHSFDRSSADEFGTGTKPAPKGGGETSGLGGRYSTGFGQLDEVLGGGYQPKSMVWVEVDPRVDSRVTLAFLATTIRDWAAAGKGVVLQKSEEIDPGSVSQIRSSLGGRGGERIMVWGSASLDKLKQVDRAGKREASGSRSKPPGEDPRLLSVVDWERMARAAESAGPPGVESSIDSLKGNAELSIVLARSSLAQSPLSGLVSAHIKIVEINGTLFVMAEKPWSELYAMVVTGHGIELESAV